MTSKENDGSSRRRERRKARERDREAQEENVLWEWTKSLMVAAVLFFVLRAFLVQTFVITSGSMEDTLLVGDMLVVNRAAIGSRIPLTGLRIPGYSEARRGDVLVFDPPHEPDLKLVKRLVGLPGDTLSMADGVLSINGQAQDEPYVKTEGRADEAHPWMTWQRDHLAASVDRASYAPTRDDWGPLVVPDGQYFMLGDNRDSSLDSRYWGLLEGWRLEGRAVFIYYSYNKDSYRPFPWVREVRWGRIGNGID
ncbi:MAG: signal peptidase I [Longimicrobiales bacterium]